MSLQQELDRIQVGSLPIRPPLTIARSATVREAVQLMRNQKLGCVVVVDEQSKAVGMFTEALLRHELNISPTVLDQPVDQQMTTRFPWVLPTDPARDILNAMEEFNTRFLAVLDSDQKVIGITGQKTLIEFVADAFPQEVMTQDPTGQTVFEQKEGA